MPALSTPDYVVLGMLRLGARSGYDVKQMVELSIRFFWTISQAQIYPSLERLERDGLIAGRAEPQGRRPRRVFTLSSAGEAALGEWLAQEESLPFELRDTGMLKLFFADALDPTDARTLLRAVRKRSEERLSALRAVQPAAKLVQDQGALYPLLTLSMGVAYHQAMVEVCEDFEHRLSRRGGQPSRADSGRSRS